MNWGLIFRRIWALIGPKGASNYLTGSEFIEICQDFHPNLPYYAQYIHQRQDKNQSTYRRDYYWDILDSMDEAIRVNCINAILDNLPNLSVDQRSSVTDHLGDGTNRPSAEVAADLWNAERLNNFLANIDSAIQEGNYNHSITLSYTCLEGFFRSFFRRHYPDIHEPQEIIRLSRATRDFLRTNHANFPDEVMNMVNHIAHTVDRTRNGFSDSHFGEESARWLSLFIRDLVNTQIRLLLHFI